MRRAVSLIGYLHSYMVVEFNMLLLECRIQMSIGFINNLSSFSSTNILLSESTTKILADQLVRRWCTRGQEGFVPYTLQFGSALPSWDTCRDQCPERGQYGYTGEQ